MLRDISAWHVMLILVVFLVLFGYKKLPDATRSLGRSMRIFKSEVRGMHDDEPKKVEAVRPVTAESDAGAARPAEKPVAAEPVQAAGEVRTDADRT